MKSVIKWFFGISLVIIILIYAVIKGGMAEEYNQDYIECEALLSYTEYEFDSLMKIKNDSLLVLKNMLEDCSNK
ncbi:MAG: hypothetical protein ABJN36_02050 [Cyclobacteriaceae bacterium]